MEPECSQIAAWLEKKVCLPPHNDPMNQGFCVADPLQCWHMYYEDINWWKYKNYSEMPVCLGTRMVWKLHQRTLSHWISSLGELKSWPPFSWIELTAFLVHTLPCSGPGSCLCRSQMARFPRVTSTLVSSHHAISLRNLEGHPPQMKTSQKMWRVFVPLCRLFARHGRLHIIKL